MISLEEVLNCINKKLDEMTLKEKILYFNDFGLGLTNKELYICIYSYNNETNIDFFTKEEIDYGNRIKSMILFSNLDENIKGGVLKTFYNNDSKTEQVRVGKHNFSTINGNLSIELNAEILGFINYQEFVEQLKKNGIIKECGYINQTEDVLEYLKENYLNTELKFNKPTILERR